MIRQSFRLLAQRARAAVSVVTTFALLLSSAAPAFTMNSALGGLLPQPLPLFPPNNWWNLDISHWPVDPNSASYIAFINNGGNRRLHPDFGGNAGGNAIYGMPYAVVTNVTSADLKAVEFEYWDESDGVNLQTGISFPFYPIPPEAITQPRWIEGGDPGNVDRRSSQDRHLLIVDRDRNYLYELFNVFYDAVRGKWFAGSGAFFDMNTNNRRPDTWTSADAAGLAILPGLVRYDEVYDPNATEIRHAFRVTVRATNGYVYPASHRAGSTPGALPMGARLRLKASVDVKQRTSDPNVRKIFRAMQRYGLIVADNGSDMYITGTYDTRWNNSILNPAFAALTASDFEVVQLGYNPPLGQGNFPPADFDGDRKTDIAIYRSGTWYILRSSDSGVTMSGWGGLEQDVPVQADYDGDGKIDIAVYRNGVWFILRSSDGGVTTIGWGGLPQDVPVQADYDGDGKADIAIYRSGMWFILRSSDGGVTVTGWGGLPQDVPVQADYDGDGKTDIAVYRDGIWFIRRSSDNGQTTVGWGGTVADVPVQADYDGDGRADIAVYRNGTWFILRSLDGTVTTTGWGGLPQDVPVQADYDGDGKTDIAVYRNGLWFIVRSSDSLQTSVGWGGLAQDMPIN
jgi:FG-GAP-like repeat